MLRKLTFVHALIHMFYAELQINNNVLFISEQLQLPDSD